MVFYSAVTCVNIASDPLECDIELHLISSLPRQQIIGTSISSTMPSLLLAAPSSTLVSVCLSVCLSHVCLPGYHLLQQHGSLHKYKIPPTTIETLLGHMEITYHRSETGQTQTQPDSSHQTSPSQPQEWQPLPQQPPCS